ncbi:MAG: ABC transporter permease [Clostridiales Family XIII bacterium]|nr:ABC transporter permease [Eubacteriales bacterium DFI.9.88]MDY3011049.1 ABC transporter permease [Clostridiales Family XIII bacterium]
MKTIINIFRDHFEWKGQILKLAKADIIKTYSGAALGWAWAIVKPTIQILVFWFAFSVGLRLGKDINGYAYILWLIAGLVPWFYMGDMITYGAGAITKYRYLVTKMKFPVSTIPTFVGLSKLVVHICLMIVVMIIFAIFGYSPDMYMLQLPIYMLFMVMFFIAWGLFSSMLSAMSKDFFNLVKAFNTPIFWLSGIMWDVHSIDISWLKPILLCNPVTYVVTGYRNVFIYKVWFWEQTNVLVYFGIVFLLMVILAVWSYKKLIREIPDVL